jgi:hypothetical protein
MLPYLEKPRELRRSARMKVEIAAKYVSDSLVVEGVVTDVSADGLFFCSDYLDGTGETVRVWLDIPWRNHPLELRGEVRWVNDTPNIGGMGIKFIDVSLEDRMVLSSLGLSALAGGAYATRVAKPRPPPPRERARRGAGHGVKSAPEGLHEEPSQRQHCRPSFHPAQRRG